jgi:hypothetical protein
MTRRVEFYKGNASTIKGADSFQHFHISKVLPVNAVGLTIKIQDLVYTAMENSNLFEGDDFASASIILHIGVLPNLGRLNLTFYAKASPLILVDWSVFQFPNVSNIVKSKNFIVPDKPLCAEFWKEPLDFVADVDDTGFGMTLCSKYIQFKFRDDDFNVSYDEKKKFICS